MLLCHTMKKLRHREIKQFTQGHSENKWRSMDSIQAVCLQCPHSAASFHYAVVPPEILMLLLEPRHTPCTFLEISQNSEVKVEKVPGDVDKFGNCLYWEDTISTKSVFSKELMHTTANKLDFEYACINIFILIAYLSVCLRYGLDRHYANIHIYK